VVISQYAIQRLRIPSVRSSSSASASFCAYGNANWEFDEHGLMRARFACIKDLTTKESERKYNWPLGCTHN